MVTQFNTKDMVSFGNFLLKQVNEGIKEQEPDGSLMVSHADFENWKDQIDRLRSGSVRAKFDCISTEEIHDGVVASFMASTDGDSEDYSKYTPCGELVMTISNDTKARDFFESGKKYYLDFKAAD